MNYKKFRWSKDYEAAEEELELLLQRLPFQLTRWELPAYAPLPEQTYAMERRLWCAEGSIRLTVSGEGVGLQPGDTITIKPGQVHSGLAGVAGCVCYEAPGPQG